MPTVQSIFIQGNVFFACRMHRFSYSVLDFWKIWNKIYDLKWKFYTFINKNTTYQSEWTEIFLHDAKYKRKSVRKQLSFNRHVKWRGGESNLFYIFTSPCTAANGLPQRLVWQYHSLCKEVLFVYSPNKRWSLQDKYS